MKLNRPETPVTKGRILRPPGDSGHPPVILRRAIQYRTTYWQKARKPRDRRLRPMQTGDSGLRLTCNKRNSANSSLFGG